MRPGLVLAPIGWLLATLFVWSTVAAAQAPACPLDLRITKPAADQPVFGPNEVEVALSGLPAGTVVESVTVLLDGAPAGERSEAPYRFEVDFGQQNREHRLEAVARLSDGRRCRAEIRTAAIHIDEEFTVELRQLYVTVTRDGRRVLDLEREDFRVEDEGARQEIITFERGDVPITAAVLVDSSASMEGARLETALAGARAFIDGMAELDRVALLLFSDGTRHLTPFAASADEILDPLAGIEAHGNTAVNDSLFLALEKLAAHQGRRVAILLSDGADVHSALDMSEVLWKVNRGQAIVYWIRLEDGEPPSSFTTSWRGAEENDSQLRDLGRAVEASGGRIIGVASLEEVAPAFREILSELREQYVIGYYPSEVRNDGSWHDVDVKVKGNYRVRSRRGYIDF